MIDVIPFERLGRFDNEWLNARYHFSFAGYHDPARMGFGPLRVWNDDTIRPHGGFDEHPHRDMEIVTYIRRGAITHRDSLGNEGVTRAGDVQVMSAGTGIRHAEFNLEDGPTTLFQIWIEPTRTGLAPRWDTRRFPKEARAGGLVTLASGRPVDAGLDGVLSINQDAAVLGATLAAGTSLTHDLGTGRRAYLVPAVGALTVNGTPVPARAGAAVSGEERLVIEARDDAEVVLVDLP